MIICNKKIEEPSLFEVVVPPFYFPHSLFEKFLNRTDTLYVDFKGDAFLEKKNCSYHMIFSLFEFKNLLKNKVVKNGIVIIDNLFILNYKCKSLEEKKECYSLLWENIYKKKVNIFILNRYKDGENILYTQPNWDFLISYQILVEKNELKIIKKYLIFFLKSIMEDASEKIDFKFKILTLGESAVGKTSILSQYNNNEFNTNLIATIGIDLIKKDIKIDGKVVRVQIWDTAGQERFYAITRNYFRNANGIFLVFDMNELRTFKCIDRWHNEIIQEVDLNVPIFLIGNKMDLIENYDEIKNLFEEKAQKKNIKFFPVSAKTGDNIEEIFNAMVREMILVNNENKLKNRVLQFDDEEIKTTKCCGIIDIRKN